ncbi:MAG: type II toxin-antitoxin system VapC family toxin [Thermodesulfobacteriota bacterium]|nr:type II toxin-antitoxin system VapC family toxin [Thermodesulfobacteriota bacterium]
MKYILDTNVLSEAVKTVPNRNVMTMLEKHQAEIATASPVWHELQYGCRRLPVSRKREIIELFLEDVIRQNMVIFPYDERAAKWHAQERARLAAQGRIPPYVDGQIAAIAKVNGLALVSRNTADFEIFTDLEVQNWHKGV